LPRFSKLVNELKQTAQSPKKRERINQFKNYIKNNWKAITIYKKEGVEVAAQRVILAMYYPAVLVLDLWVGARKG
jgi:hypothetical protein